MSTSSALSPMERRAAWSLSLIYIVRMLGLFIILPVFSLFADDYTGSTPFWWVLRLESTVFCRPRCRSRLAC